MAMDFEKEAREIAQTISGMPDPGCFEARDLILWFARRAYTAGQEDMRERSARFVEPGKPAPCDCIQQTAVEYGSRFSSSCYCRSVDDHARVVMWCSEMNEAARIRLLPLLSPDHEKVGGK